MFDALVITGRRAVASSAASAVARSIASSVARSIARTIRSPAARAIRSAAALARGCACVVFLFNHFSLCCASLRMKGSVDITPKGRQN